jgi:hypothetical protein
MSHLERLGDRIAVSITTDDQGYMGRECPNKACLGYFKVTPGTGLAGVPCHCPYCGHTADHGQFWSHAQIEYAKSVALHKLTAAVLRDLKDLEFEHKPRGLFGIGLSMRVSGRPHPIHYYREQKLETEVTCETCGLRYAIYGVFGYCPDCGVHNSAPILHKNLEVIERMVGLATTAEDGLAEPIIANALEDAVSAFDGFGREVYRLNAPRAAKDAAALRMSFQDLTRARERLMRAFGIDLAAGVSSDQWERAVRCFQKRHLLAHAMGVVDEAYIRQTGDVTAAIGRKVRIEADEVTSLVRTLRQLGTYLVEQLNAVRPAEER